MSRHHNLVIAIIIVLVLITGCGKASPTVTLPQPTVTSIPPTAPPTATAMLPTNTSVPTAVPPTATPEPAPLPTPADGGGLIAFVSDRDGNGEIYVMNADGSDQRRLTHFRGFDGVPAWSPDGRQIAFYTHLTRNKWAIQVMDADGSNQRPLTDNNACDGAPFWSPDGTRIVFTSAFDCDPDDREIVIMNADGSNQLKLTDNDADDYLSAWSPDSQQIAFVSDRDGNDEIYIMNADGTNVRRLTFDDGHDRMPAWSPDGTQIAFVSDRDGNPEVYVMDADGGNPRRLTDNNTDDWFPSWSPDGVQLLFNSRRDGGDLDVYVMTVPDGTNVRRLTDAPGEDFNAVWQPLPTDEHVSGVAVDTWVRTYEGDPRWAALDALQTGDGGYLLIGSSNYSHQNTRREDIYLVKAGPTGEIAWAKAYGGDDFDRGNAVIQADDSGFVILGETKSFGAGDWDMILLKVDADGNELWSKTFGGPAQERATAIQRTADGGYILVGSTKSFGAGGSDLYLVKTDDRGNEVWAQTYGGELDEVGYDVHQPPDGGFLVLAQVIQGEQVYVEQSPDVFLLRTDERGNEIWSQVWEEENVEGGHVLLPTSDGNYIIAGITGPAGSQTDTDFLFLKMDADGNPIWNKPFGDESAVDYGIDVIEMPDGGYLLIGMFSGGGRGAIPLIKTDGSGQILWTRNLIEGRGNKAGIRVFPAPDGGYVVVGITDEHRRAFETVLIKTDSEGKTQTVAPPAATVALPTATATPVPPPGSSMLGDTWTRPTDGMVMVYVPEGEFQMGSDDAEVDAALQMCNAYYGDCEREWFEVEQPVHPVVLDGFWLDRTEVTNAQYRRCVEAGACSPPKRSDSDTRDAYYGDSAYDDYPVVHVTWSQADAYCPWAGGRLPTEAEWEYAARGPEGRRYPWGEEYDGARLNSCDANCGYEWAEEAFDDGYGDTAPVGSYPNGASWCGALDMAGNVWEWMADWFGEYSSERQSNPTGPSSGTGHALRGDAADGTRAVSRAAARHGMEPGRAYKYTGFRCAVSTQGLE